MNIREHAKALYDNWFNTGQPRCIFDAVIWPICAIAEKADAGPAPNEDNAKLYEQVAAIKREQEGIIKRDCGRSNEAPNEEAVRAALVFMRGSVPKRDDWAIACDVLYHCRIEGEGTTDTAARILAAEVRRLRGSEPVEQNAKCCEMSEDSGLGVKICNLPVGHKGFHRCGAFCWARASSNPQNGHLA